MAEKFHFPFYDGQKNINWFSGAFEYPHKYVMNWNRFQDWITDLEWLGTNSVILIIFNYADFMNNCAESKKYIMEDLQNTVDFWENEAENCIVGGQRKDFNVYIVMESYDYYCLGTESLKKSDYKSAVDFFEKSNRISEHYKTYEKLFLCFKKLDENSKAYECLKKAYQLNQKSDKISVMYAEESAERNDFEKAHKILSETLKRNPTYKPAEKLLETISNINLVRYTGETSYLTLTHNKIYKVWSIEKKWYRIVDDSGEDYLYPPELFERVYGNIIFKSLDMILSYNDTMDYWYDEGFCYAQKLLADFSDDDWQELSDIILSRSSDYQKKLVYCFDGSDEFHELKIIEKLLSVDDDELFIMCVDSLRNFSTDKLNKHLLDKIKAKADGLVGLSGIVIEEFFKEI